MVVLRALMAEVARFSLLVTMVVMIIITVALAADDAKYPVAGAGCKNIQTHRYVNVTEFRKNLNAVFASLRSTLSSDSFAISTEDSFAVSTDPVYGLAVCEKYLTVPQCIECFTEAATKIKAHCPISNGARILLDGCFLRYENSSFYGEGLGAGFSNSYCSSTNDTDPQTFSERAHLLATQLITNASTNNSYAVGSINGSLYGLAQCWPSVMSSNCQRCFKEAQNKLLGCIPHREGRALEAGCTMRYSNYSFFTNMQTSSSTKKKTSKLVPVLLGSVGGTALIAVLCLVFWQRNRHSKSSSRADENLVARGNFGQIFFNYKVLRDSTRNFDRNNMLGKGGFGEVYKGRLPDGRVVAVKKLNGRHTTQAAEEFLFLKEVKLISSVRHRNLVRLLGCCTRGHERLLVYEFMSNNSLDKHLFGEIETTLSWETRLNIIVGTARGLAYLHEDSNVRIIHRDIKCANILLDDRFYPKIADFGLARLFPEGETHVSTKVGGTLGYIAPEYAVHGQLSEKADVYSYGIVVLEIVSGRKCLDARLEAPLQPLLERVRFCFKELSP
eukprot:PITA_01528